MKFPHKTNISELLQFLREHDALQIDLLVSGSLHIIGVRSDYETRGQGLYFAKHYFIGENDYLSPIDFSRALTEYAARSPLTILRVRETA